MWGSEVNVRYVPQSPSTLLDCMDIWFVCRGVSERMCAQSCVWAHVCAYHSTHVRSSENSLRYQSSPSTLLEAGPLYCLDATHIGQLVHRLLGILPSLLPISLWESWDCRCLCNVSGFSMDSEELDSGPHTQEASTLTHKPSSLTLPPCYWFSFWCRISPWPGAHWFS